MKYDFDKIIERKNTNCVKWDTLKERFGSNDILPMWVADMDFEVAPEIIEAIKKRTEHGIFGYTIRPQTYYESIINWVKKRHSWEINREWLGFSPGVVPALAIAVLSFTDIGDKIIIQPPIYPPFFKVIKNNGRQIVENPLKLQDGKFVMDFDDLESKIDSKVKMLMLCSPHNPVGRVWDKDELEKLSNICLKHNIIIVSDEIHSDIVYKDKKHIPIASLNEAVLQNTITFIAPSKTFNIAGLSTSATIIPNKKLRDKFENTIESLEISSSNVFGIVALESAYKYGEEWLDELLKYLEGNINLLMDFARSNSHKVNITKPEGTYLAWLNFKNLNIKHDELVEFMIKKAKVGLNSGLDFGSQGEGFLRLNFACPRILLEEGLYRIEKALK
ncbi:pyridoxal phosphate-dependent aminotransferase [Caloramator sp. E03]|uniref:MalY/PatB family protein n=1 Tax=Caloramator sp. E03 TaxID=2576307 RepID=UPI001110276B|nr:MalY/PatB family protein [Caloramator sp. E03]QCX34148.1 pyridoxal phosphate-dependent aminotransferase [Caloramator sp. E03]